MRELTNTELAAVAGGGLPLPPVKLIVAAKVFVGVKLG